MTNEEQHYREVTLREYVDLRMIELEKRNTQQHELLATANELARESLNVRLDSMNEFRETINDTIGHCVSRNEWDIQHQQLVGDVHRLQLSEANLAGKASQSAVNLALVLGLVGMIFGGIGTFIQIVHLLKQ